MQKQLGVPWKCIVNKKARPLHGNATLLLPPESGETHRVSPALKGWGNAASGVLGTVAQWWLVVWTNGVGILAPLVCPHKDLRSVSPFALKPKMGPATNLQNQGGCKEGAGRVQGGCKEGARRVQGGCKEGSRRGVAIGSAPRDMKEKT